jgi:hypothetical protein
MIRTLAALALAGTASAALAANLIVVDARGGGLKPGQTIDSAKPIALKEGERATLIGPDGRTVTLRGVFSGPPMASAGDTRNPKAALAALITNRNARATAVGAIRAGANAQPLPDPWLIDISRPGPRCIREGEQQVWWRPDTAQVESFTVYPVDRSWRADFGWQEGQDRMAAPRLSRLDGANTFIIRNGDQDNAISLSVIPKGVDDPLVLSAWLVEKGCFQQADALLKTVQTELDAQPATPAAETTP